MRRFRARLASWRRRREPEAASGAGVDRRTMLVGAAATAGIVAAGAAPALASPAGAAPGVSAASGLAGYAPAAVVAASDVSVVPAGEIIDTNAQAALEALDRRLSKAHLIDDLQVAMTIVDDFMGNTATSGTIGQLGWALGAGATGTAAVAAISAEPGLFNLTTGTTATGWQNLNLGNNNLMGTPVLMCEWRVRISPLNDATDTFSCWLGLDNNLVGTEPMSGFYFRYTAADGPNWRAVCANAGARTVVDTTKAADTNFHRFRITNDGGGVARFYIDSVLLATIITSLPAGRTYSPSVSIRKTAGTASRGVSVDYFALRYERAR
jgi:hypothetical protein